MLVLGENLYMFEFVDSRIAARVLADGPWGIDGYCLCLKEWPPDKRFSEINLEWLSIWIQFHGLTLELMSKRNSRILGGKVGRVIEVEGKEDTWTRRRSYMRVRVEMKVTQLLVKGDWVKDKSNKKFWVEFKYERISNFCFTCGKIDHTEKNCKMKSNELTWVNMEHA